MEELVASVCAMVCLSISRISRFMRDSREQFLASRSRKSLFTFCYISSRDIIAKIYNYSYSGYLMESVLIVITVNAIINDNKIPRACKSYIVV